MSHDIIFFKQLVLNLWTAGPKEVPQPAGSHVRFNSQKQILYMQHSPQFFIFSQKEEAKERKQDEENKAEKQKDAGKGGKGRGTKKIKDECLPTPNARRVEPRVDPALRMKADKTARAKLKAQVRAITLSSLVWFTSSREMNSTSETHVEH